MGAVFCIRTRSGTVGKMIDIQEKEGCTSVISLDYVSQGGQPFDFRGTSWGLLRSVRPGGRGFFLQEAVQTAQIEQSERQLTC